MNRVVVWAGVLWTTMAWANAFETYGVGPRATALGGAVVANSDDFSATFYNPAMLPLRSSANFGFAMSYAHLSPEIKATTTNAELDCQYCQAPDAVGFDTGFVLPFGGKLQNRLAIGVGLHLPVERFLRVLAADTDQPFWLHHNSNPERFVLYAGAGVRITDSLSLGIGMQALQDLVGNGATVSVDLFARRINQREIDSHLQSRSGPTAGLLFSPIKQLRFGASFRWEMALRYLIPADVEMEGVGTLGFRIEGEAHYSPHTLTAGMAWDVTDRLTVSLDGQWMNWSAAPSPYVNVDIDMSGETLRALGLDEVLDVASPRQLPGFSDTLNGRLGIEYRIGDRFVARAGGYYRPTPVPRQDVPGTNILDGNTVGVSMGLGISLDDPLEVFPKPLKLDVAAQGALLMPREATKEPTDSVPSYTYSARQMGMTAAVRYDF